MLHGLDAGLQRGNHRNCVWHPPDSCYRFFPMNSRPLLLCLTALAFWTNALQAEKVAPEQDYLRYVGDEKRGKLETITITLEKNGATVDLIGAVHIADAAYYQTLRESFPQYDVLLFELVDGQKLQPAEGEILVETGEDEITPDQTGRILQGTMKGMGDFLKLQFQTDGIDYQAKNFVHADVSWARFVELQAEKGETWGQLFQKTFAAELKRQSRGRKQPELRLGMLLASLLGDPSALKVVLAKQIAEADELSKIMESEGSSVIIGERNKVALDVFREQLKAGKKKLGIFYGVGHLPDFEKRLVEQGWKRVKEHWNTAWEIVPKVLPEAQPLKVDRK